jgi:transcriptional regulator with XRE-family HTH domain
MVSRDTDPPPPSRAALVIAGVRIEQWRHDHRLSQTAFGRKAGISKGTVAHLEKATRVPLWSVLQKVATAMAITVAQLLDTGSDTTETVAQAITALQAPGLLPEDLQVAYMFSKATGRLKTSIWNQLVEFHIRAQRELKGGAVPVIPAGSTFPERRSGIDRRQSQTDGAAVAVTVTKTA